MSWDTYFSSAKYCQLLAQVAVPTYASPVVNEHIGHLPFCLFVRSVLGCPESHIFFVVL